MKTATKPQQKTKILTGIYEIRHQKGSYIGQSTSILDRANQHADSLADGNHHNYKLQKLWNQQRGKGFTLYLIQECQKQDLDQLENYWIEKRGDLNIDRNKPRLPKGLTPKAVDQKIGDLASFVGSKPGKVKNSRQPDLITRFCISLIAGCVMGLAADRLDIPVLPTVSAGTTALFLAQKKR